MVTIKQIAELCGVSRGTVDRVLNGRGKVKPEKAKLVLDMAAKLHYHPNPAGKALAARKKHPTVGVLLLSEGVHFFDDVLSAMHHMADKYDSYGLKVIWRSMRGFDLDKQCAIIDELREQGINALIIDPLNHPRIIQKIDECVADKIFVVTLNNDIEASHRQCYVGPNYPNGGKTAAALLCMIHPQLLHTGVLLGSLQMLGHRQRLDGFLETMQEHPDFHFCGVEECEDDDMIAYEKVRQLLLDHPELNSIFIISAGAYGAARAVLAAGRKDSTMIVFDTIPTTIEMMKKGVIQAALYQHPHQQGQRAMQVVFDYLVNGIAPEHDKYIMRNEIRILQNVE